MKSWYTSKAMALAALTAILGVLETADLSFLPDQYAGIGYIVIAALIAGVRVFTNTGLEK